MPAAGSLFWPLGAPWRYTPLFEVQRGARGALRAQLNRVRARPCKLTAACVAWRTRLQKIAVESVVCSDRLRVNPR